jgi:putative endonuclease
MSGLATTKSRQHIGQVAEDDALAYLLGQGLTLVTRNFRCRVGEIDLIMQDGETLVFVEVRARGKSDFGEAAESITRSKQRRLIKTAQLFLQRLKKMPPGRFDAVTFNSGKINWLKNIIDET